MKKLFAFAVMACAALTSFAAPAFADAIECPLTQARRAVTNTLEGEWYTTPIVSSLTGTRLQTIAGQQALACLYGEAGQVQRLAPRGQTCIARTGGFDCRATLQSVPVPTQIPAQLPVAPVIQSQGDVVIRQTYTIDLEYGAVGAGAASDLFFEAATPTDLFLTPQNGARAWAGDLSARGRSGCEATRSAAYSTARIALSALPIGSSICVRTNDNHYSEVRIVALTPSSPRALTIHYTTWRN